MKVIVVKFTLSTPMLRSEYSETKNLEFEDDETEQEINTAIDEIYEEWVQSKNQGTWTITDTK